MGYAAPRGGQFRGQPLDLQVGDESRFRLGLEAVGRIKHIGNQAVHPHPRRRQSLLATAAHLSTSAMVHIVNSAMGGRVPRMTPVMPTRCARHS
jgi:hypothetical protein